MPHVDYDAFRFWWDVIITVLIGVNTIYTWHINRDKTNRTAFDMQSQKIQKLESDLKSIQTEVKNLPSHNDLGVIHEKVNEVSSGMRELRGELGAINRTLLLINEHLINHGDRRQ